MSETPAPADTPARVFVRYDDADGNGRVSLPGYLNAVPGEVEDGDVFSIDGAHRDEVVAGFRFTEVDAPAEPSPNAGLTKAVLGEKLGLDEATVKATSKDDLVELADEYDRENPIPPSDPDGDNPDASGDGTPEGDNA